MIRAFRDRDPQQIRFLPIEYGSSCVARWTIGEDSYEIYHDSTAGFTFSETAKAARESLGSLDSYFGRMLRAREEQNTLMASTSDHLWGGRPDLVLEVTRSDGRRRVLLGEVKYTRFWSTRRRVSANCWSTWPSSGARKGTSIRTTVSLVPRVRSAAASSPITSTSLSSTPPGRSDT